MHLNSEYVHLTQRGLRRRIIFEDDEDRRRFVRLDGYRPRIGDEEAKRIIEARFGKGSIEYISAMKKPERDERLAQLRKCGLSIRQIERLTGIGRGIIANARE